MPYKTMSLKEAAECLGYSPKTMNNKYREVLAAFGIRYIKSPNGRIRVITRDVERYQDLNMVTHGGRK